MPFRVFRRLEIPDVVLIEPVVFTDARGFFKEIYKRTPFLSNGVPYDFVQANISYSRKGVVRGLHYQLRPMEQGKLVTVVKGRIFDVAVDIRAGSPWYGRYFGVELSSENHLLFWIPPGFAHGFQALEDSIVLYLVTKEYARDLERCIRWDDPQINIAWPLREDIIISRKDEKCPLLAEAESNFHYEVGMLGV